ncbi:MAG: hypothetical protein GYB67_05500, partial [Chloroflexi bacterium]|nr:hypothetical protein [Chloroflexota bacterium]
EAHIESNRQRIFEIVADYPNVLAMGGHWHTLDRLLPGEDFGIIGELPFPVINAGAVCGSWWSGVEDEFGVPRSFMRCGAPRGYLIFEFDGTSYSDVWKASGRAVEDNMHITFDTARRELGLYEEYGALSVDQLDGTYVVANVYSGSRDTVVTMSIDGGDPIPMERNLNQNDPLADRSITNEGLLTNESSHIYTADLPTDLEPGVHTIVIDVVDLYGQTFTGTKVFDVWAVN